jgi:hypothetical protein
MGDLPVARPLPARRTAQTQNKRIQTSMSQVRFEPTIPVFEQPKTVHALDCAANVIGIRPRLLPSKFFPIHNSPIILPFDAMKYRY